MWSHLWVRTVFPQKRQNATWKRTIEDICDVLEFPICQYVQSLMCGDRLLQKLSKFIAAHCPQYRCDPLSQNQNLQIPAEGTIITQLSDKGLTNDSPSSPNSHLPVRQFPLQSFLGQARAFGLKPAFRESVVSCSL